MRSILLFLLAAPAASFLRPRDPAMAEVADILKGILSNLTKHRRSLLRVGQHAGPAGPLEPHVLSALQQELAKLQRGDRSTLDALYAADPAQPKADVADVQAALRQVVGAQPLRAVLGAELPAGDATVLFVERACANLTVNAEALVKAADKNVVVLESSSIGAPFVDRSAEMYFVPASGAPRRFAGAWNAKAVQAFVADRSPGKPRTPRALAQKKATKKAGLEVNFVKTADALKEAVDTAGKDLFVTFFAPWCPHCQTFVMEDDAPLKQLATKLEGPDFENLRVLAVDVTEVTEIPSAFGQIQYIPAVFYLGDRSKLPEQYQDDYGVDVMYDWLEDKAKA